jgi:hypothetical protein
VYTAMQEKNSLFSICSPIFLFFHPRAEEINQLIRHQSILFEIEKKKLNFECLAAKYQMMLAQASG